MENQSLYQLSNRQFGISEEVKTVELRALSSFPLLQAHPLQAASEAKSQCHLWEEVTGRQLASSAPLLAIVRGEFARIEYRGMLAAYL